MGHHYKQCLVSSSYELLPRPYSTSAHTPTLNPSHRTFACRQAGTWLQEVGMSFHVVGDAIQQHPDRVVAPTSCPKCQKVHTGACAPSEPEPKTGGPDVQTHRK